MYVSHPMSNVAWMMLVVKAWMKDQTTILDTVGTKRKLINE